MATNRDIARSILTPSDRRPAGWRQLSDYSLLPLRIFLGGIFSFAGLQKLSNPNFFHASSPISIQASLLAATRTSPIHALLHPLLHAATLIGFVIAYGELAVGLGILLGLFTRVAAVGGIIISLNLFLTVSFHDSPFFTSADLVYMAALVPLVISGSSTRWSLDAAMRRYVDYRQKGVANAASTGEAVVSRRAVVVGGAVAAATATGAVILGTSVADFGKIIAQGNAPTATSVAIGNKTGGKKTTVSPGVTGTLIGSASTVPVGGSATFTIPTSGDPGIIFQPTTGTFVAFDAVCPHAGCQVGYAVAQNLIVCPCHGSEFAAATGQLLRGPATHGLTTLSVVEGRDGNLYLT